MNGPPSMLHSNCELGSFDLKSKLPVVLLDFGTVPVISVLGPVVSTINSRADDDGLSKPW
jgi:hypothetical protein